MKQIAASKFKEQCLALLDSVDLDVCRRLRDLDFESDSADQIIAATSLARVVLFGRRAKTNGDPRCDRRLFYLHNKP